MSLPHIVWFSEVTGKDFRLTGAKGSGLGELFNLGAPVPNGFIVTTEAFSDFLASTSLKNKILSELSGLDMKDTKKLLDASSRIKTAIMAAQIPELLMGQIKKYYHDLCGDIDKPVAVRPSTSVEDSKESSFAGQHEAFLNVRGYVNVVSAVQKCWASLFDPRAIFYRTDKGISHLKVSIAVPVQLMIQSEVSGTLFTVNPLTNDSNQISIEAGFGLGQALVSGEITPDQYLLSKEPLNILSRNIATQTWLLTEAGKVPVSKAYREVQKLPDSKILELAKLGTRIEGHYGYPCDIEWGFEKKKLYIVQVRPVAVLRVHTVEHLPVENEKFLLSGLGASPGMVSGPVKLIKSPKEITKLSEGDILVSESTGSDFESVLGKVAGIVTNEGGRTSHAAIISRELGIPAIVGTKHATQLLKDGEIVTLNVEGTMGRIYEGDDLRGQNHPVKKEDISAKKTATKIYVNLSEPEIAKDVASKNVDGVGLLRAEFMIARIGEHPKKFLKEKRQSEFISKLSEGLLEFAKAFDPRPVIFRASDFRTNEYRNLRGGSEFEPIELNPMLGLRGASRYLHDPVVFNLELEAIKVVRNKYGFKNLHLMLPFVRTVDQLREVKKFVSAAGLRRGGTFKIWMLCEVPSNVILLDKFIEEGIDGVSIGSNDLTTLILGVDKDNELVSNSFSELDPAVLQSFEKVITTCRKHKVASSICGQASSESPDLIEQLVEWGIYSVSVRPDIIEKTRKIVYEAERKILHAKSHSKSKAR